MTQSTKSNKMNMNQTQTKPNNDWEKFTDELVHAEYEACDGWDFEPPLLFCWGCDVHHKPVQVWCEFCQMTEQEKYARLMARFHFKKELDALKDPEDGAYQFLQEIEETKQADDKVKQANLQAYCAWNITNKIVGNPSKKKS